MWSPWPLHADALVVALAEAGERAAVVDDPVGAARVLVADVAGRDLTAVLGRRRRGGRSTLVWGGTLDRARVAALSAAGASAYVSELARPGEVAAVVRAIRLGEDVAWPEGPPPMVALTPRERAAARAYLVTGAGRTRAEVAQDLGISERTLKAHIANVRDKVGHEGTATREGLRHELAARGWVS